MYGEAGIITLARTKRENVHVVFSGGVKGGQLPPHFLADNMNLFYVLIIADAIHVQVHAHAGARRLHQSVCVAD